MKFEWMKYGYTPVIIKDEQRATYYEVLNLAHITKNYGLFIKLVTDSVAKSEELWLSVWNKSNCDLVTTHESV